MKDFDAWRDEILDQIKNLKLRGRHSYYAMSNVMSQSTAKELEKYFKSVGYNIEMKGCAKGFFDIIIVGF